MTVMVHEYQYLKTYRGGKVIFHTFRTSSLVGIRHSALFSERALFQEKDTPVIITLKRRFRHAGSKWYWVEFFTGTG
jgi:hypothetical protein